MKLNSNLFDRIVGVLGVFLSVSIFISSSDNKNINTYFYSLSPVFLFALYFSFSILYKKIKDLRNSLALVTGTNIDTKMIVTILNNNGDVSLERIYKIALNRAGSTVHSTVKELLFSHKNNKKLPPKAHIISSSRGDTKIVEKYIHRSIMKVNNIDQYKYEWAYDIKPPLKKKNDYIKYKYLVYMGKEEESAFSEKGSMIYFEHSSNIMDAEITLISPPNTSIIILETFYEDDEGNHKKLYDKEQPVLYSGNRTLIWKPKYRRGERAICKYRIKI